MQGPTHYATAPSVCHWRRQPDTCTIDHRRRLSAETTAAAAALLFRTTVRIHLILSGAIIRGRASRVSNTRRKFAQQLCHSHAVQHTPAKWDVCEMLPSVRFSLSDELDFVIICRRYGLRVELKKFKMYAC